MFTSEAQHNHANRFETQYQGFQLISEPFRHHDNTFSPNLRVLLNGNFVFARSSSCVEQSFSTASEATQAALSLGQNWVEKHTELWSKGA